MQTPKLDETRSRPSSVLTEPASYAGQVSVLLTLIHARGARSITIGHGKTLQASSAARTLEHAWIMAGGDVLDVVAWPEQAASWLRQAGRFASGPPDLWVMAGAAFGWAQMTRRLLWSTPWQPQRTLVFGEHLAHAAAALVGIHNVEGLAGTTAAGTWTVHDEQLTIGEPAP
jgi:hypothetical protein